MGLQGDEAQVEARFDPFGDSATLDARLAYGCVECNIGSEIILVALDGTPRSRGSGGISFRYVFSVGAR
jgi:hypothetical protein